MASRSLLRLKGPQSLAACCLKNSGHRTSVHQLHRHSSNIVQSPFREIEIPNQRIPEIIWETVDKFPDSSALVSEMIYISYKLDDYLRSASFVPSLFLRIRTMGLRFKDYLRVWFLSEVEASWAQPYLDLCKTTIQTTHWNQKSLG